MYVHVYMYVYPCIVCVHVYVYCIEYINDIDSKDTGNQGALNRTYHWKS